jgi:tetratricopeptide (TPR) repeat protein
VHAYERSAELEPRHAEVHFNLGNALYALGKKREAVTCFQQAVRLEPDYVEAWNNLGNALSDTGQHGDAVAAYKRALALAKDYADAHYNLAETLALMNDIDGAREHWLAYLERDPTSTWADQVRERLEQL